MRGTEFKPQRWQIAPSHLMGMGDFSYTHRLNMKLDLLCLFGLHVQICTYCETPQGPQRPPSPSHLGSCKYEGVKSFTNLQKKIILISYETNPNTFPFSLFILPAIIRRLTPTVYIYCIILSNFCFFSLVSAIVLKVHKIENFVDSDFGICGISLLVMHKWYDFSEKNFWLDH